MRQVHGCEWNALVRTRLARMTTSAAATLAGSSLYPYPFPVAGRTLLDSPGADRTNPCSAGARRTLPAIPVCGTSSHFEGPIRTQNLASADLDQVSNAVPGPP